MIFAGDLVAARTPVMADVAQPTALPMGADFLASRPTWFFVALVIFIISTTLALVRAVMLRGKEPAIQNQSSGAGPIGSATGSGPQSTGNKPPYPAKSASSAVYRLRDVEQAIYPIEDAALYSRNGFCIGRLDRFNDLAVQASEVSKRHARFRMKNADLVIEDLNSTNGTWLNSAALEPFSGSHVRPGDQVSLGGVTFTVEAAD